MLPPPASYQLADFDVRRDIDGTPAEVASGRERRGGTPADYGEPQPVPLARPALVDTAVWTWARDRRFPVLAEWFNTEVKAGRVLVCDLVILELVRLTPNQERAHELALRLGAFETLPMPSGLWSRARAVQLSIAAAGDHRRVPPPDLLIAATAERSHVPLVHYDRDYERSAAVTAQEHVWFVPDGALAGTKG